MGRLGLLSIASVVLMAPAAGAEPLRLTVDEAVAGALAASDRVAALDAVEAAATAQSRAARAARLPEVEARAGYTRLSDVPELSLPTGDVIFPNIPNSYVTRLEAQVPVYAGGRIDGAIEAAHQEQQAAAADVGGARATLAFRARAVYWDLVTALEQERVARQAIAAYDKHLADARNREQVGLAARSEVLAIDVEQRRAELARLWAEQRVRLGQARIADLCGLDPGTEVEPVEPLDDGAPAGADGGTSGVVANRPEITALSARAAAAQASTQVARAALRPQIVASAGYDLSRPNRRLLPLADSWDDSWDVGLALRINVFDGGRRRAAVARAEALADAAARALADGRRSVLLEVTEARLELDTARAAVPVARSAVESAAESRRVSADRYGEGVAPSSELLDAETVELRVALELLQARARVRVAEAALARALGI